MTKENIKIEIIQDGSTGDHAAQLEEAKQILINEMKKRRTDSKLHHEQEISAELFLFMVISLQVLICFGQRKYPKRFQEISFGFLFIYPIQILYHYKELSTISYGFLLLWMLWGSRTLRLMYLSMGPPFSKKPWKLKKETPEKVYSWFLRTHRICYILSGVSLYLFFFLPGPSLLILFVSLYFGVLGRDCAEVCADRMSNTIGYLSYDTPPTNVCALCDVELRPTLEIMLGEKSADDADLKDNPPLKLECGHEFHTKCIQGWTLVGKKDTCPFCHEKVRFADILPQKAWNSPKLNVWWVRLLVVMRYLLVWNPIVTYASMYTLKLFHFEAPVDSHGKPIY